MSIEDAGYIANERYKGLEQFRHQITEDEYNTLVRGIRKLEIGEDHVQQQLSPAESEIYKRYSAFMTRSAEAKE
jgi:hypothetical protein